MIKLLFRSNEILRFENVCKIFFGKTRRRSEKVDMNFVNVHITLIPVAIFFSTTDRYFDSFSCRITYVLKKMHKIAREK